MMDIRLPRLLMAILSGAMLGMAGAAMQSITRNGPADPGLIGVKEGCSAAVLLLIFQFPALGLARRPLVGMAGGLITALLVWWRWPRYLASAFYSDWDWRVMGFLCGNGDLYDHRRRARCADGDAVAGRSLHAANWTLVSIAAAQGGPGVCATALYRPRG